MNRTEKVETVESLAEAFRQSPHVVLAAFRGMTANQSNDLRRRVRSAGGSFRVLKNRLARRAAEGTAVEKIRERLAGTCALASHASDPVSLAKALAEFSKENPQLRLVAAVVDSKDVLEEGEIKALSMLPGLPELRAQFLALLQTPGTQLVRLLSTPAAQVARALDARREQLEGGS